jgi:protein involved in polysaccharide export with SLBB domain
MMNLCNWPLGLALALLLAADTEALELGSQQPVYLIGPNDVIHIQVFGEADLTVESKVEGDGTINYPLLGVLRVSGRTTGELQRELTERLAAGYVRKPKVNVSIVRHRNIFVSGEVRAPGGYPYEEGLTVQKAITLAGGFTERGDKASFQIVRKNVKGVEALSLEMDAFVMPDDLIVVERSKRFYVNGEVKKPGDFPYEKDLTLHKAITIAGGFTDKASIGNTMVLRKIDGQERSIQLDLDSVLFPEDIVVVPRRFF